MNITPQVPNLSIPTVLNPHTESLRRENNQREIITQPAALSQSAAEKGVASDRERSRSPAQNNAQIDFASISEQAELANTSISGQNEKQNGQESKDSRESDNSYQEAKEGNSDSGEDKTRSQELEQERVISLLKKRDQEVRSHESAHSSVGGSVTGSPNFSYEQGPDGRKYAVEGEVSVDLSSVNGDPRATIAKMQKVHAAALAPIHPSTQDTQVANTATQIILQAQSELLTGLNSQQNQTQSKGDVEGEEQAYEAENLSRNGQRGSPYEFQAQANKTLNEQDKAPLSQPDVIVQRALRIESYYADITHAYEKPQTFKFELTA